MARYVHGLRGVFSNSDPWLGSAEEMIQLSLGYTLHKDTSRSAFAKPERGARWFIGLSQGVSNSHLNDIYSDDDRPHYAASAELRLEFARYFHLSTGICYMQRGGPRTYTSKEKIRLNYLTFPLMFGFSPVKTKPFTLSVEGGLAYEVLVSSKIAIMNFDDLESVKEKKSMNSWICGVEISSDAVNGVNIFMNYHFIEPMEDFFSATRPGDFMTHPFHIGLSSGGRILSIGARMKL